MAEKITTNVQVVGATGALFTQQVVDAPTANTTVVHAAYAGNNATAAFPGPFTSPTKPRNVTVTFGGAWDGGDVTVVGTDQFGAAVSEVIADAAGTTVAGVKIFATVTSATKESVGASSNTASIGAGAKLGLSQHLTAAYGFCMVDQAAPEAATWDATYSAVTPTSAPKGSRDYGLFYPVTSA